MKLGVVSDLHLSMAPFEPPRSDADLIVLAGDIARPDAAMSFAKGIDKPVLYVAGNHEFYGGSLVGTIRRLKELASGSNVIVLDNETTVIGGVRFVGSTLWTDFESFDVTRDAEARATAERLAIKLVRDFSRIRVDDESAALFTPTVSAEHYTRNTAWIKSVLDTPFEGTTVVITHHAPSLRSIHPKYDGSPLNACFVSDAESLMGEDRVALWIHGHMHDTFDYRVRGTRVVCNPRGYRKDGANENRDFAPGFTVDVPRKMAAAQAR